MQKIANVTITGAAGQIGYALVFRVASGQMLGPDVKVNLRLLELPQTLPALEGVVMELQDCAFATLGSVLATSDVTEAMDGANYALLVGAVPRKAGMERKDLLSINGGVFSVQGRALNAKAASDVRVLVVGNPCNTNCLIAMHNAPDIPKDRFFAMTMLDENRARFRLAEKAHAHVSKVSRMAIWGNHSATQYPDFYNALIDDKPVIEVIHDQTWLTEQFIPLVQQRGAEVIKARGASSAASAANAALTTIYHLVHDTECFSVACCSQGEYGILEGLIFSYPCSTKNGKLSIVEGFKHNDFAKNLIKKTTEELLEEFAMVKNLGLIT